MNRMERRTRVSRLCAAMCTLALVLPGISGCLQGGGTDIGNALVTGTVQDGGVALAGAKVLLMPEGYNPVLGDNTGAARTAITDDSGKFTLKDVRPGRYSLETRHPEAERMDWIRILDVEPAGEHVADPELAGARTVLVRLPETAAADAYVFIPGTDVYALRSSGDTTGEGRLRLRHVPDEAVPVLGMGRSGRLEEVVLFPVSLNAKDTVVDLETR